MWNSRVGRKIRKPWSQDRALPGGIPGKWGPQAGRRAGFCARTILTIIKDWGGVESYPRLWPLNIPKP